MICLTATPDDGYIDGNEHKLIGLMGYKVIRTGEQNDMEAPLVDTYFTLKSYTDVVNLVNEYRDSRAVLIYATDVVHNKLAE